MKLQTYQRIRIAIVIIIAMVIGQSVVRENFLVSLVTIIAGSLTLLLLRRRVPDVMADERDYAIAGSSALLAIQIFSWIGIVAMLALYAARDMNPSYEPMGMVLAFSITILMMLYAAIFHFRARLKFSNAKAAYAMIIIVAFLIIGLFTVRALSGEDNWICENGAWVMHGHPSFPAPTEPCTNGS